MSWEKVRASEEAQEPDPAEQTPREELLAMVRRRLESPGLMPESHKRALRALEVLAQPRYGLGAPATQQRCSEALAILRGER